MPKDKVLIEAFGSRCLCWGSNYPKSESTLAGTIEKARAGLASLSQEDREWIFGKTARHFTLSWLTEAERSERNYHGHPRSGNR